MKKNILLSYPRSGNHLCRFFIELLTELPTYGVHGSKKDIPIYQNLFPKKIPFNIKEDINSDDCFHKYHIASSLDCKILILIIRNPREVLLSHNGLNKLNINNNWASYNNYFKLIDFYNNFKGKKLLLYYEDIITQKRKFIYTLYNFLKIDNPKKKEYVIKNIDDLYKLSENGKNRAWGGVKSNNNINFYYEKINKDIKKEFDDYLEEKLKKYPFLKLKYNI